MDNFSSYAKAIDKVIQKKMGISKNKMSEWLTYLMILSLVISFAGFFTILCNLTFNSPFNFYLESWVVNPDFIPVSNTFFYYLGVVILLGIFFAFFLLIIILWIEKNSIGLIEKYSEIVNEIDKITENREYSIRMDK